LVQKTVSKNIDSAELAKTLRVREISIVKSEGGVVYFRAGDTIKNGKYDKATGMVSYMEKQLPALLTKFNELHKASSRNTGHLFSVVYGILLFFLAVSSFWMYKPGTKIFRQGIYISIAGMLAALLMFWL